MQPLRPAIPLLLALLGACASNEETPTFEDALFEHGTQEPSGMCPPDCLQVVEFCRDGWAAIQLTDVVTSGTYERRGDEVVVEWGPGDVPDSMTFTILDDEQTLRDDYMDLTWTRNEDRLEDTYCFQRNDGQG